MPDGSCVDDTLEDECLNTMSGTSWNIGLTCDQVECPPPTGACCLPDGSCIDDTTEDDCLNTVGGYLWFEGETCAGGICPPPPTGGLQCEGTPPAALVTVDEEIAGTLEQLAELPVMLQPGVHRVQVTAPGYFPWFGEVEVGTTVEPLRVELRAVPE